MVSRVAGPIQGWAVLCVGVLVTLWMAWGDLSRWTVNHKTAEHLSSYQVQVRLEELADQQAALLQDATGMLLANGLVDPGAWEAYVRATIGRDDDLGVMALGYIPNDAQHPSAPLVVAQPGKPMLDESAWEQVASGPNLRAAMDESVRSNRPVMSDALAVPDPRTNQALRAICMPIEGAHERAIHGWTIAFTSPAAMIEQCLNRQRLEQYACSMVIYDGNGMAGGTSVFGDPALLANVAELERDDRLDRRTVMVAGRPFAIYWVHQPLQYSEQMLAAGGSVLLVGFIITLLLHALVRSLHRTRMEMEHDALHDALTGLPNRALLKQRLSEAMRRLKVDPNYRIAVLYLDFDHFKVINDSLGHPYGDELLKQVAGRLHANLRTGSEATRQRSDMPVRLGGDEFVVLMEAREAEVDAVVVADRLGKALAEPYDLMGQEVVTSASIGIVIPDEQHAQAEDVMRDADLAMYHAKERGRARYALFDMEMREKAVRRHDLEVEMRHALEQQQLYLLYQPITCLESGRIKGFEALVRWKHPRFGVVNPDEFIPIAEETGMIVQIGYWVLRTASRQLAAWREKMGEELPLFMNVNASRRELTSPGFVSRVEQTLAELHLPPGSVKLEITESTIMSHYQELTPIMQQLRELGIPLCMDDFGTGHSSLSCLHLFPIDVLKIDRAFVRNMGQKIDYTAIVQAVVTLAHTLHMTVVAEGIETADQLAQLQALESDLAQGYYFAKPLPVEEAERWMRQNTEKVGMMI